jgi:hypothetical protein
MLCYLIWRESLKRETIGRSGERKSARPRARIGPIERYDGHFTDSSKFEDLSHRRLRLKDDELLPDDREP